MDEKKTAIIFKAFCDENRIRIIKLLRSGEKCACKLLEEINVTQPTLSHDMKLLVEAGIVKDRRDGKNIYYSLDEEVLGELQNRLSVMFQSKPECICHSHSGCGCNN